MGNGERLAEEATLKSNGVNELQPASLRPASHPEISEGEAVPSPSASETPLPFDLNCPPQLRPLSISRPDVILDAHGPPVSDIQEFDFWSKPGKRSDQGGADGQPVSSPKLWAHGGRSRTAVGLQEEATSPSSPLAGAFGLRDSYLVTEGGCAEVGEFGGQEAGSFGALNGGPSSTESAEGETDQGVSKDKSFGEGVQVADVQMETRGEAGMESEGSGRPLGMEQEGSAVDVHSKETGARVSLTEAGVSGVGEGTVASAESASCAFVTKQAASSSSTLDSAFSVNGPLRTPSDGANGPSQEAATGVKSSGEGGVSEGPEPVAISEGQTFMRTQSEDHLSDTASVSSAASHDEARSVSETPSKAARGRLSDEIASTSGRTGTGSPKAGLEQLKVKLPVSRPLYTDTPAMANDVVFGVSTFGKLGRANSFATGSISGATVFTADGSGHRRSQSEGKKVSFFLGAVEGKKAGGGVAPESPRSGYLGSPRSGYLGSPRSAIRGKEGGENAEGSSKGLERFSGGSRGAGVEGSQGRRQGSQKGDHQGEAGSKDTGASPGVTGASPGVSRAGMESVSGRGKEDVHEAGRLAAVPEGGSPKVIDRSALFKKWLEKNKDELAQPEQSKGLPPTPILQRIGSSNDVLPPPLSRRSEDRSLKRTISHSAITPPHLKPPGEIQSLEGGYESPTPSPRRKSSSTPSSPVATPPGKHMRQLSIGSSKPPKAPKSPPASTLPPKHPHSPSSKAREKDPTRSPREKQLVSHLSLGPATIDAAVDLGPSSSGTSGSPPVMSRNLGRLPPARVPSPKTNSVLRKAMSQSKAEPTIPVGALLVEAGLPADPKDAIPQLIARIIKSTNRNLPPLKPATAPQNSLTAPKLSQVAPLPQKRGKNNSGSQPEPPPAPSPSDEPPPAPSTSSPAADGLLASLSPRALLRSTSLPSYLQSVLPTSLLNSFSAQASLTAPEPKRLTAPPPSENPQTAEDAILLLGRLALAGDFEQEHGRALLAQAKGPVTEIVVTILERGPHADREAAAGLTRVLTLLEEGRSALLESNGLQLLVEVLWSGSPRGKVAAASTLRNLAYKSTDQKRAIMAAGAIGPLVSLLRSTTPGAPEAAASALRSLAMADGMEEIIVKNGAIQPLVRLLHSPQSPAAKEASAATLQNLATDDSHRSQIVEAGAIPALFKMLLAPEISSQMAAAGALRNLAAGGAEYQRVIGESGAAGPLVKILGKRGPNVPPGMPEAAAGALANLALFDANKSLIAGEGGIPALTELVRCGTPPAQLVGMEALKNLATDGEISELVVKGGAILWLVRNLGSSERRLQRAAVRVLYALGASSQNLGAIKEHGAVQALEQIKDAQSGLERDDIVVKLLLQLKSS